jgi:hypothetical protein
MEKELAKPTAHRRSRPAGSRQVCVDPGLRRDDGEYVAIGTNNRDVMPAVMAEPCFAWTAGTHASFSRRDDGVGYGRGRCSNSF